MLDFLMPEKHAISILKKDHDTVKDLFDKFEKAGSSSVKERIISKAVTELKIHAVVEEEIFYPTVRKHVGSDIMNEADEEHHVARALIAELDRNRRGGDHRESKFPLLAERAPHRMKEEETEMLPKDAEHSMVTQARGTGDSPAAASRKKAPSVKMARQNGAKHSRTRRLKDPTPVTRSHKRKA